MLALDTNVLVYAEGDGDASRCAHARELLRRLPVERVRLAVQVLGELHQVLTRRLRKSAEHARRVTHEYAELYGAQESNWRALAAALELHAAHGVPTWDALIVAVAADQGCRMLLSEDFQSGFAWGGVTIVDPFRAPAHPLLLAELG